jgi:hypothetical protein
MNPSLVKPSSNRWSDWGGVLTIALFFSQQAFRQPILFVIPILALFVLYVQNINYDSSPLGKGLRRVIKHQKALMIGSILLLAPILVTLFATPSEAVMLTRVQNFMANELFGGASLGDGTSYAQLVNFVFNALRGIYMVWVVVAGVQGFQQLQQKQGLSDAVQLTFFSLITIFAIDMISFLVIPATA